MQDQTAVNRKAWDCALLTVRREQSCVDLEITRELDIDGPARVETVWPSGQRFRLFDCGCLHKVGCSWSARPARVLRTGSAGSTTPGAALDVAVQADLTGLGLAAQAARTKPLAETEYARTLPLLVGAATTLPDRPAPQREAAGRDRMQTIEVAGKFSYLKAFR